MRLPRNVNALILLFMLLLPDAALAEGVGIVTHLSGLLKAQHADGTSKILSVKSEVLQGDTLQTEPETFARIKFSDGGEVVLRPKTVFKVQAYNYKPDNQDEDGVALQLIKGGMRSVTGLLGKRNPEKFKVETQVATIGIRGTHFGALLCSDDCDDIATVASLDQEDFLPVALSLPLDHASPTPCQAPGAFITVAITNPAESFLLADNQPLANGLYTDTATGSITVSNSFGTIEVGAGGFSHTPNSNTAPKITPSGPRVTMPPAISNNKGTGKDVGKDGSGTCSI